MKKSYGNKNYSNEELTEGVRKEDSEVISHLLKTIALHLVNKGVTQEVAEDMAQEAILTAWQALHSGGNYQEQGTFVAWLKQVAFNKWAKFHRKDKKMVTFSKAFPNSSNEEILQMNLPLEQQMDADLLLQEKKFLDENLNLMHECVMELKEPDRTIVELRIKKEMSYEQIAQVTGLTISSLKTKYFRAKNKLKKIFHSKKN